MIAKCSPTFWKVIVAVTSSLSGLKPILPVTGKPPWQSNRYVQRPAVLRGGTYAVFKSRAERILPVLQDSNSLSIAILSRLSHRLAKTALALRFISSPPFEQAMSKSHSNCQCRIWISATCKSHLGRSFRCCRAACREAGSSISYYFRRLTPHNRLLPRS